MCQVVTLLTERLRLRQWQESDYLPFAAMNADPAVMAFYPKTLSVTESDALADMLKQLIATQSWGFWAVEIRAEKKFIGFVGINRPSYELPVSPCIEVGWRLDKAYWGKGYATEAAKQALRFAFDVLAVDQVYAFTSVGNSRSRAVMERVGMVNAQHNFDHPIIPAGHPLSEHVLYQVTKDRLRD